MKKPCNIIIVLLSFCLVISGCSIKKDEGTIIEPKHDTINLDIFIPNKSYKVVFDGTDLAPNIQYIKGNGKKYQAVGTNGRGAFVNVYALEKPNINCIKEYNELSIAESQHLDTLDFLNKDEQGNKEAMLWEPLVLSSKKGNSEIIEIDKDLKLDKLQLKGHYIKVQQVIEGLSDKDKTTITSYYSQGLGRVKYNVRIDNVDIAYYVLKDYMICK